MTTSVYKKKKRWLRVRKEEEAVTTSMKKKKRWCFRRWKRSGESMLASIHNWKRWICSWKRVDNEDEEKKRIDGHVHEKEELTTTTFMEEMRGWCSWKRTRWLYLWRRRGNNGNIQKMMTRTRTKKTARRRWQKKENNEDNKQVERKMVKKGWIIGKDGNKD